MGGISGERAFRIQQRAVSRLADSYSLAWHFKSTWKELTDRNRAITQSPDVLRCPARVRSYLSGYEEARRADIYCNKLVWMLSCDNRLLTSKQVDALTAHEKAQGLDKAPDYKSPWSRIDTDRSVHVWKDTITGEPLRDRPYSHVELPPYTHPIQELK